MSRRGAYGRNRPLSPVTLGERIRAVRLDWRWSQDRLARAVGADQRTLSSWERNVNPPSGPALELLAAFFGLPTEALLTGEGFRIPVPPAEGAADTPIPYLAALPPPPSPRKTWLVDRRQGAQDEVALNLAIAALRRAHREGRASWVVLD